MMIMDLFRRRYRALSSVEPVLEIYNISQPISLYRLFMSTPQTVPHFPQVFFPLHAPHPPHYPPPPHFLHPLPPLSPRLESSPSVQRSRKEIFVQQEDNSIVLNTEAYLTRHISV